MPIVEVVPASVRLTQGDILSGIKLFATEKAWTGGGEARKAPFNLCLVVSRPCAVGHKGNVIVVAVAQLDDQMPKDLLRVNQESDSAEGKRKVKEKYNYEAVLKFLKKTRDGHGSPDLMYLGQIPSYSGRHCARLDSFHTINVPTDSVEMVAFLRSHRVGRLSTDFARDLHIRIFGAVASLGFDDYGWYSDDDLNWLVREIAQDISLMQAKECELLSAKAAQQARGQTFPEGDLARVQESLRKLREATAPFIAEQQRRSRTEPSQSGQ